MHRLHYPFATGSLVLILALLFGACNDSITGEDPDDNDNGDDNGDPVFVLSDIEGSWQQEDEPRRYLDIQSDESEDGTFYEAFFQDDEEEFGQADCYAVVRNEVIATNEGEFTFRSIDNGDEEEVVIRFEVDADEDGDPQRIRMIRQDNGFDAWFEPAELTVDDFEPRCEEEDDNGDNGDGAEAVTDLSEIDGSWQQTDEERRYLDVVGDEGEMGWFYEAFFQDDEEEFDETECYAVTDFEIVGQEDEVLLAAHPDEGDEIEVRFSVERDEEGTPTTLHFAREDTEFEATFEPSDLRLDDFEPECE